jgi:hypothetical protein
LAGCGRSAGHDYFTGAGAWLSGLIVGATELLDDPVAIATGGAGLDVLYPDNTGGPWHSFFASPRYSWVTLPLPGSGLTGLVVPVLTRNGGEDAFFTTTSGELDHDYFTGTGPWIGPGALSS